METFLRLWMFELKESNEKGLINELSRSGILFFALEFVELVLLGSVVKPWN